MIIIATMPVGGTHNMPTKTRRRAGGAVVKTREEPASGVPQHLKPTNLSVVLSLSASGAGLLSHL